VSRPNAAKRLSAEIALLEDQQSREWHILKEAMEEAFSPAHLARTVLEETRTLPLFRNTIFKTLVGLGTGWFSGKILRTKELTVKSAVGSVAQFVLSYFAANHADGIRTVGEKLFHKFFRKKQTADEAVHTNHNGTHPNEVTSFYSE